ncbi:MAG TPA: alpha/beta hydrolase [Gemmatimonadaceae bacterium]|nr:alpha/beta hydrolase [Gemmatimonadaceae bacterium]
MNRFGMAGIAALPALAIVGAGSERIAEWRDSRRYPAVGHRVSIGARELNLHCAGSGAPTIVYEAGKQIPGFFWTPILTRTSAFARSCWYDRAGMGWSDPAPAPRTAAEIASDLHALLHAAGERPPYVLVAHSLGGFYARVFNASYRDEVAGLVLIDPASEDIATRMRSTPRRTPPLSPAGMARVARTLGFFGVPRFFSAPTPSRPPSWTASDWRELNALEQEPSAIVANSGEGPYQSLGDEARAAGGFGSTPVLVLSAGHDALPPDALTEKLAIHRELAAASTNGRAVVIAQSGHFIPLEFPDTVVWAVRDVVERVRRR